MKTHTCASTLLYLYAAAQPQYAGVTSTSTGFRTNSVLVKVSMSNLLLNNMCGRCTNKVTRLLDLALIA